MNILTILFGLIFLIVSLAGLYYFIRSLIVMFNDSPVMGILGFLFAPIVHIIFYFTNKDKINAQEASYFKRYLISIVAIIVLGIVLSTMAMSSVSATSVNEINSLGAY